MICSHCKNMEQWTLLQSGRPEGYSTGGLLLADPMWYNFYFSYCSCFVLLYCKYKSSLVSVFVYFQKLIVEDFKKHKNKEATTSKGELWIIMSATMSQIIFWHISALKHERNRSMMESFDVSNHLKQLKIFIFLCVYFSLCFFLHY